MNRQPSRETTELEIVKALIIANQLNRADVVMYGKSMAKDLRKDWPPVFTGVDTAGGPR